VQIAGQRTPYTLFGVVDALTRIAGRYENAGDRLVVAQYAVVQILVQVAHPCGHDLPFSQRFSVKIRSRILKSCSRAENLVGVFQ
jgi:hypothetical protein